MRAIDYSESYLRTSDTLEQDMSLKDLITFIEVIIFFFDEDCDIILSFNKLFKLYLREDN